MSWYDETAAGPVAVIGVACRFPGADGPDALWRLLEEGRHAIGEIPAARAASSAAFERLAADAPALRYGGYLDDIAGFDAEFFGVSPREAAAMDPQQRLVLELAWEALEDAGVVPADLGGTATGVFVGGMADEYAALSRPAAVGRHTLTGTTRGVIANRVSYLLGLRGPSVAVDSAQSSSLVSVHLACQSLRRGESRLALAGGVNLIVDPGGTSAVAAFGGLSPDGRCHTFDRRANGYVRGEGAGLVLLKPLDVALADGDEVYAVIRGSAVNNDGATGGLTVPDARAQAEVVQAACAAAGVSPADLHYVELHGTGTPVGDPVEAAGLGLARGEGVSLLDVGSVKTNIGHLEGAAGIAGLIKTVLGVHRRRLPASLNFSDPNPAIDLAGLRLRVRDASGPWPREDEPPLAGVSSFGMGGTNCHLIVGAAPADAAPTGAAPVGPRGNGRAPAAGGRGPLVLSARSATALRDLAGRLRDLVDEHGTVPDGLARALATTRTAFDHRAAVSGDAPAGLGALAAGRSAAGVVTGTARRVPVAVLFPGQGSQRPGMGRRAHREHPAWRAAFDEVAAVLDERLPRPLTEVAWAGPGTAEAAALDRTAFTQPALFAVEVATFRLLESLGLRPGFVAGHSIGEVAAAHCAGMLTLEAAADLIVARGRLMDALPAGGAMLALGAGEHEAGELLGAAGGVVALAAVNGPSSVVVSGEHADIERIGALAAERGLRTRALRVGHAFHSPLMDPMLDAFRTVLEGLDFGAARIPFVSSLTGERVETTGPDYWVEHARRAVRFADGLHRLHALGAGIFVESGPGTALSGMGREVAAGWETGAAFVPVLGKADDVETAVGRLFTEGVAVDWDAWFPPGGPRVKPPTYPFQRERFWLDSIPEPEPRRAAALAAHSVAEGDTAQAAAVDVERLVLDEVAAVLGHGDPDRIARDAVFRDLGFDSLGLVDLRERLGAALGTDVPAATLFAHPTIDELVVHLSVGTEPETVPAVVAEVVDDDPVVIVGMGCRFPGGVESPEDLWELVADGVDATGEFPGDRGWDVEGLFDPDPDRRGRSYTRRGGFLLDAGGFDAGFFGLSPREALATDPQQRLLLQVVWESLERAGIDPTSLKGTDTGVFIGATSSDYAPRLDEGGGGSTDGYLLTGGTVSVASGRIAYVLGLGGRALTVDTACSSSLVALDLAVGAVRSGECGLALAGGVAVMATPGMFVEFSRQRGLSPDGRCRAFGAGADGTGWAEGVGVLVVERLSRAHREGHRVLAVVRGSAVNSDGASNGLTAPNGRAQEAVIGRALADAGLGPADVDVVEGHGTGTRLGDPIEAQALIAAYGRERGDGPLWLGSLKSNVGHAQAAAGVGGVIKMVMALRRGVLPRTLHVQEPSPLVRWDGSGVALLRRERSWPAREGRVRRAGVSSFGISGTNAHIILEEPPASPADAAQPVEGPAPPVLLSGNGPDALRRQAAALADHLTRHPDLTADAVAGTLLTRARLSHGAAVAADDTGTLSQALRALAAGEPHEAVLTGETTPGRTVFVFPGQGSQWPGMARALLDADAVFRAEIEACAAALAEHTDWSLLAVLRGEPGAPPLERVDVVQPALFAVMAALAAVWQGAGVRPDAVVGHSQGEIAAAYVAGALGLDDAARLVALRSKALTRIAGGAGMASVALGAADLEDWPGDIEVAVRNGPRSTVVGGPDAALAELLAWCEERGVRARRVPVDYASHTRQVEPLRDHLLETFAAVRPGPSGTAFYSAVTGDRAETTALDAAYWYRNLRETVRFDRAVAALADAGHTRFVEVSPHPVLTTAIEEAFAERDAGPVCVTGTLRRDEGGPDRLRRSLAAAHLGGAPVAWARPGDGATPAAELPTYRFERRRYWLNATSAPRAAARSGHPLFGEPVQLADGDTVLAGRLDDRAYPWLADHRVLGTVIAPGVLLAEAVAHAGGLVGCPEVRELTVRAPLVPPAETQIRVGGPDGAGRRTVTVHSRTDGAAAWIENARGVLVPDASGRLDAQPAAWPPPGAEPVDVTGLYEDLFRSGYDYGTAFQRLTAAWREGAVLHAEVELPEEQDAGGFVQHPALLDAALHPVVGLLAGDRPLLPFAFEGLRLTGGRAARTLRVRVEPLAEARVRLGFSDGEGAVVGEIASLAFRPADLDAVAGAVPVHRIEWVEAAPAAADGAAPASAAVLAGFGDVAGLVQDAGIIEEPGAVGRPVVLVPVGGTGDGPPVPAAHDRTAAVLGLLRRWIDDPALEPTRLVVVLGAGGAADLSAAPVRGLLRTAASEHPGRFALVETDAPAPAALLAGAVGGAEPEAAVQSGRVLVPRLVPGDLPAEPAAPAAARGGGTVLVTGGTGTLGALIARHLVSTAVAAAADPPHLLLVSRSGPDAPGAADLAAELRALGAGVTVTAADLADRAAVAELISSVPAGRPLRSVVHAAGTLDDATVAELSEERLRTVLLPKVDAAWHLHELTAGLPLEDFVLFSSAVATTGAPGQANYAAGNAFLDALAAHRHARGLPARSLAWGVWDETSAMTRQVGTSGRARLARYGVGSVPTGHALAAFDRAPGPHTVVSLPDQVVLRGEAAAGRLPALLSALVPTLPAARRGGAWPERLRAEPPHERPRTLLALLRDQVAAVLGHEDPAGLDADRAFKELGFDSLTAVELRNRLNALTGLTLPATVVFEFPTVAALGEHLLETLTAQSSPSPAAGTEPETASAVVAEAVDDDPVVIVGMGCRFPGGVESPEDLWDLVAEGVDATGDFPGDRGWDVEGLFDPDPDRRGRSYTRRGGFLSHAGEFDAGFFGLSPREALATDPQQRLLLQVVWESLERAGIDPTSLKDTDTAVFIGAMYDDYGTRLKTAPEDLEGLLLAGTESSVASGRIAYVLGLGGRALTVDTACSSSLVALDLAVGAVRSGECGLALAGGVAVMATPGMFVEFSRQRGLSPDGRCRAFGAGADGTGWAEGVGVLVVERLSRAHREGHRVLAVVRGSAVNSDGASNGLTAPSGRAQEAVIGRALADAGLGPGDVDVVEGHGTGTRLGDPIEAQALIAAYGRERGDGPLWLGSLKSNVGHAQAAAGVGGVIKMVMALRHGVLPRTLHADEPSPLVRWDGSGVALLRRERSWPVREGRVRRAGVSSFGISGTNAHIILEEPPDGAPAPAEDRPVPLVLSAKTPSALRTQAGALHDVLTSGDAPRLLDTGFTLDRRARFEHRAVVHGTDASELLAALTALHDGTEHPGLVLGEAAGAGDARLAFLFAGQGTQRIGMGAELLETSTTYATAFDEVSAHLEPHLGVGLRELVSEDAERLRQTRYAQPALFAVETALYRLAERYGLRPDVLIGHSVGEIAAAHVAGILDLATACALVAVRGRLMQSARDGGAMAAFAASEEQAAALIAGGGAGGAVEIAAVNAPGSVVLSGDAAAVDRLVERWRGDGRRAGRLKVGHAFHSHHMEDVLQEFRDEFRAAVPDPASGAGRVPAVPIISTVTGAPVDASAMSSPEYWVEQIRRPVRFADAVRAAHDTGVTRFAELGPDGSLSALVRETIDGPVVAVPLLREGPRTALGRLHAAGVPVDLGPWYVGGRVVDLPTYPFETRRYWLLPPPGEDGRPDAFGLEPAAHPLLGGSVETPDGGRIFTGVLSERRQPWLAEHRIDGRVLVPAAVFTGIVLAASGGDALEELVLRAPLELGPEVEARLQVGVSASGDITVRSRRGDGDGWVVHVTAATAATAAAPSGEVGSATGGRPFPDVDRLDVSAAYAALAGRGYEYGPRFQGLRAVRRDGDDLHAVAEPPAALRAEPAGYGLHPALLDAALHAIPLHDLDGPRRVPATLDDVHAHTHAPVDRVQARFTRLDPDSYKVEVADQDGRPVLTIGRLGLRALTGSSRLYLPGLEQVRTPEPLAQGFVHAGTGRDAWPDLVPPTVLITAGDAEAGRRTIRRWLDDDRTAGSRLVFLLPPGPARAEPAALRGLVRSVQAEHPGRFALLEAEDGDPGLLAAIGAAHDEAVFREGAVLLPRLSPHDTPRRDASAAAWPRSAAGGTVLVTGGAGAVGRRVAAHLARAHGVRRFLLAGRRGPEHPDAAAVVADLAALGADAAVHACDVTDRQSLTALLDGLDLAGVVHAAGFAADATVQRLSAAALRDAIAVKAGAAAHLDELTRDRDLDAFVLFGSVAGALGTAGQAGYAAANAALEAVAHRRRDAGLPALALHWGLWDVPGGLASGLRDTDVARLERAGIRRMDPGAALALMDGALALDRPVAVAANLDLPRRAQAATAAATAATAPVPGLLLTPRARATGDVESLVLESVAAVLGHASAAEVDPGSAFGDLGLDSLMAVELRDRLAAALGVRLPGTVVFDHPTPAALARFLAARTGTDPAEDDPSPHGTEGGAAAPADPGEAIAIVGMACRFPGGVRTPAELWELLDAGVDAVTGFPADRGWAPDLFDPDPDRPGTSSTRHGGFLRDAAEFDPAFFGISPREALAVDPQQRLLLTTAWEAVEDAGIDPATLRGGRAGVFVGVMYSDYGARLHQRRGVHHELEGYLVSGSAGSVASGRIAYTLGLEGPAITVDTACSSSLVAVHQAAQALRLGECSLALAGGATVMASPATFIEFSRQRGLAPDGRCKPFSADADGTAWGEGAGLLLLERLSDARRNGHRVLAVVRGSAVNQDGASNGLTAPNGPSQERVIGAALRNAGLRPRDVDVLEAHGTGTALGDPIEAGAVLAAYGSGRDGLPPLVMGSVKSNLGHTQAAAGAAGIMKAVLAMRHGRVPGTLHAARLTDHVDWESGGVEVPAESVPWPDTPGPRRAAVSSFGISGTNAHVVLEEGSPGQGAPGPEPRERAARPLPWVLSARGPDALREQAARLRRHVLAAPGTRDVDIAFSLATTRTAFEHRAVVVGRDRAELLAGLGHLIEGTEPERGAYPIVVTGSPVRGRTAVVFTGQGSQRAGMGAELHRAFPAYARAFDEARAELLRAGGPDVAALVAGDAAAGPIDRTRNAQAALFAVEVALFRLLESWGLDAGQLAGHSVGEIAAAHVAGALSLADAAALVAARGRLMQDLPEGGAMVSVRATAADVARIAAETGVSVDLAAVNAPESVVLSGEEPAVAAVAAALAAAGRRTRRLTVSHAFHSALMEPMLDAFEAALDGIAAAAPDRTVVSTLTAEEADAGTLGSPAHWARHARGTVRFADAVARLRELGVTRFVEAGPDAALTPMIREADPGGTCAAIASLNRRRDDLLALWSTVARAFAAGVAWDWRALLGDDAVVVPLPTYPFARERLWLAPPAEPATASGVGADEPDHPLLAASVTVPGGETTVYTGVLSHGRQPWIPDHALHGTPLLPAAALADVAGWLARRHDTAVAELVLHAPLVVAADEDVRLTITVDGARARIHARAADAPDWTLHAEVEFGDDPAARSGGEADPRWTGERPAEARPVDLTGVYASFAERGYDYGPAFQGLRGLWRTDRELHAEVDTGGDLAPGLLDACLHAWLAGTGESAAGTAVDVPFAWRNVRVLGEPSGPLRARIRLGDGTGFALDVVTADGRGVLSADEVRLRPVEADALRNPGLRPYELAWLPEPIGGDASPEADGASPEAAEAPLVALVGVDDPGLPFPVVSVRLDEADPVGGVRAGFHAVRDLILGLPDDGRLTVVTSGAVSTGAGDAVTDLAAAAVWGLVRAVQHERPGRVGVIDVDGDPGTLSLLPRAVAGRADRLALRRGEAFHPELRPTPRAHPAAGPDLGGGTVLVTGAGGALGAAVTRHLVTAHGVRDLLLVSRRGDADPALRSLAADLGGEARVEITACDVADAGAVEALLARTRLTAVVHAAGVLDDAVLENVTPDALDRVLRPKVDAAWNLHRLTAGHPLRAFVLFSSIAGTLGSAGQSAYAAGNAFLDALALHRRASGLPATSLPWGQWDTGMASALGAADRARIARLGVRPLGHRAGLDLFDRSLASGLAVPVPVRLDPSAAARGSRTRAVTPLPRRLDGLGADAAAALVRQTVARRVSEVLGLGGPALVPDDRGLFDIGLDSLTAIELRDRLSTETGFPLPATVLFDHPNVGALTTYLLVRCGIGEDDPAGEPGTADEEREPAVPVSDEELFGLLDRELSD
ncbi:SDR family NAD(P)-dependent oxidoreductase [Actinomadura sp. 9N215]|uniref:SDR family NAD(P)-dependent oxidoreductase n=1 Tax=Actinomadura sp. 9N215 TaxID=3375150 RepID=UPI003795168F